MQIVGVDMDRDCSQHFVVTVQAHEYSPLKWEQYPLMRLPVELTRRCLELLDFRGRIRASHVSRAWRTLALSNRSMWNLAVFSSATQHIAADILEIMLLRSHPLPFSFIWDVVYMQLPSDLFNILLPNMHRMAEITVPSIEETSCFELLSRNAPHMRSFICDTSGPLHGFLPSHWGGEGAPHLRVLHLGTFGVLPRSPCFSALRSFRGDVPAYDGGRIDNVNGRLYNLMPNLTSLDLSGITQTTLTYLKNPPACLQELRLRSRVLTIDYSALLEQYADRQLRILHLGNAQSASCAVRLFTNTTPGLWSMEVSDHHVALESESFKTRYVIDCGLSKLSIVELLGDLERLEELTLSLDLLVELYSIKTPGFVLPSLRSLNASLDRNANVAGRLQDMAEQRHPRAPIRVPQLISAMVTVDNAPYAFQNQPLEHTAEWLADDLPHLLKTLLDSDVPCYENLTVSMLDAAELARRDLSGLRCIAACLRVEDRSKGEVVQFAPVGA